MAAYKDTSTERLRQLVEAKVAGKEIVTPPAVEHVQVLSLMDALKKSVAEAKAARPLPRYLARSRVRDASYMPFLSISSVFGRWMAQHQGR